MTISIYNTLTKKKEIFKPIKSDEVKIYVCGPTVYDECHIGHARSAVVFDVIVRYFRNIGFKVTYVRNFTDIDDKIIERAKKMNMSHTQLSNIYIDSFRDNMKSLNVIPADYEPRVTDHIDNIIQIVKTLIDNRFAYVINGDVYFSVETFDSYGKLSGRNKKDMIAGSRIRINKNKNNPLDFAIWKSSKEGEPSWQSPWGYGRPGWHIECSAMSTTLLDKTIDIHGGGEDLIFPHHENEIAQSESANQKPLAHYWVHNGLVNIKNKKMSKSLGNWKALQDIIELYNPEAIRLFLLSNHYRNPISFSQHNIKSYEKALTKIYRTIKRASKLTQISHKQNSVKGTLWNKFCDTMNDDFNTAKCIGILFNAVKEINNKIDNKSNINKIKDEETISNTINDILSAGKILGILNLSPDYYLAQKNNNIPPKKGGIDNKKIEQLIADRKKARANKNWIKADKIRDMLNNMGIKVEDKINNMV